MKIVGNLLLGLVIVSATAQSQSAQTSKTGLFQVDFNLAGRVSKVDVKQSTGSAAFDQKTGRAARASWRGEPGTSEPVVIDPNLKLLRHTGSDIPRPPYPVEARRARQMGSGVCLVTFDASGHVASQVMTKSTGWPRLDENTLTWARYNWKGKPNATVAVPLTYRLEQ